MERSDLIKTIELTKHFGKKVAVDNLSLEIPEGEFFTFLGPNAAGKTTTIKMLTGLIRPTKGRCILNGIDIQKAPLEAKKIISYIPDNPYLYEKLTAKEFLFFTGGIYNMEASQIKEKTFSLLEMFNLSDVADNLIEEYSHGMRQKLIFCAAFLHDPRIIIIDEPMVGLDPKSVKIVKNVLKNKSKEKVTIFMSTHTLSIAEELSDRIGIIDHGRLIALGTQEELKKKAPQSTKLEEIFLQLTKE
jgi:ABC-2 type transport system ATP-binding protein